MLRILLITGLFIASASCVHAADPSGLAADMEREFGNVGKTIASKEAQVLVRIQGKAIGGKAGERVASVTRVGKPVSAEQEAKNKGVIPSYPKGAN